METPALFPRPVTIGPSPNQIRKVSNRKREGRGKRGSPGSLTSPDPMGTSLPCAPSCLAYLFAVLSPGVLGSALVASPGPTFAKRGPGEMHRLQTSVDGAGHLTRLAGDRMIRRVCYCRAGTSQEKTTYLTTAKELV